MRASMSLEYFTYSSSIAGSQERTSATSRNSATASGGAVRDVAAMAEMERCCPSGWSASMRTWRNCSPTSAV
jgi:hypothetical protein